MKLLLVASSGGHLRQLFWMRPFWEAHERVWVTFDTPDAAALLAGETVVHAHHPTNRSLPALARNLALARRVLARERPALVLSTGAGVGVPFLWLARTFGARAVFVEVYDRVDAPSLTGRLVAPFVDTIGVQREGQLGLYRGATLLGPVR